MTYRYTEEELADIRKRMDTNLSTFQRNSGRGLPADTVQAMAQARGVQLNENGEPIAKELEPAAGKRRKPRKARASLVLVATEEEECRNLCQWAKFTSWHNAPIANVLIHVPNGAYLGADPLTRSITMGKLKSMGVQPGVFDYIVPVPIWEKRCAGLWLEMKRTKGGQVSDEQGSFGKRMQSLGWRCEVVRGWELASKIILEHLRGVPG